MQKNWILRGLFVISLPLVLIFASACTTGFGPQGGLFTSTKVGVYGTDTGGAKSGKACAMSILGLIAIGDGSVQTAADEGGVKTVKSIDLESFSILGVFAQLCTVTHGD